MIIDRSKGYTRSVYPFFLRVLVIIKGGVDYAYPFHYQWVTALKR